MTAENANKTQAVRGILEAIIVAALLWAGSSLIALREQNAVMQNQLSIIQGQLLDVPSLKLSVAKHDIQIEALNEDMREVKRMKGLQ